MNAREYPDAAALEGLIDALRLQPGEVRADEVARVRGELLVIDLDAPDVLEAIASALLVASW